MNLRHYQQRAVEQVLTAFETHARVLLTMQTGAGKTITAKVIGERVGGDILWLCHRRELVDQAPGRAVTVQSLLNGDRPPCDLLIADECHHLGGSAEQWEAVARDYPRILGLTATPARHDGAPLDLFTALVAPTSYSELIRDGYLMEPKVVRPAEELEGLAQRPEDAWRSLARDRQGFAFFSRVEQAQRFAAALNVHPDGPLYSRQVCGVVHGEQPADERRDTMDAFRAGRLRVLANVQVLTEGVDVPRASVAMIARGCQHAGAWLQMVGRVLRPAEGKQQPMVIDLPGISHRLGLPHEDRVYSLDGQPIRRLPGAERVQQCEGCGAVYPPADHCPACGLVPPPKPLRQRVWGVPMAAVDEEQLTAKQKGALTWKEKMLKDDSARLAWFLKKGWPARRCAGAHRGMFGVPMPNSWFRIIK